MKIVKKPMQACFCRLKAKGDGRMKNYARELDMELERIHAAGLRPRLLRMPAVRLVPAIRLSIWQSTLILRFFSIIPIFHPSASICIALPNLRGL